MANDDDIDELKAKSLCHRCVGEGYLGAEVRRKGHRGRCSYCGRIARTYTVGWEVDYSVSEQVPPKKPPKEKDKEDQWFDVAAFVGGAWGAGDADLRDATLRIDLESVKVHVVRSVQFQCDAHDVRRHRWEKTNTDF